MKLAIAAGVIGIIVGLVIKMVLGSSPTIPIPVPTVEEVAE